MAMTDDEKLARVVSAFKGKLHSIETWSAFKTLISSITKSQVKTFIKNALQQEADKRKQFATDEIDTATDYEALKNEVGSI